MGIAELPLFTAMKQKMHWHQDRQSLLAENVANAETPGYQGRDLKAFSFKKSLGQFSSTQISTATTNSKHMQISIGSSGGFGAQRMNSFEVTPEGNAITLEDEMMKVTANQLDYQMVTTLYTRSLGLYRSALGR